MPILTVVPPPQTVEVRSLWETEETAVSQGPEGQLLRQQIENVSQHWRQQSSAVMVTGSTDLQEQLSRYQHPPFERVGLRRVRYIGIRDLKPRRIQCHIDEDTNE